MCNHGQYDEPFPVVSAVFIDVVAVIDAIP